MYYNEPTTKGQVLPEETTASVQDLIPLVLVGVAGAAIATGVIKVKNWNAKRKLSKELVTVA